MSAANDPAPEDGRKSAPGQEAPADAPWKGTRGSDERDRLWIAALSRRSGAVLSVLVEDAFGPEAETGGAEYHRARRFYRNHPDWFQTEGRDGLLYVEPTPEACRAASLDTASKRTAGTPDCGGTDGEALANAKAMCRRRRTFPDAPERGDLLGALGAKREATEDRFHALADTFNPGDHLLIPYCTRFNSERRVREARDRYQTGWSRAADQYDVGVVATLTTDPARYESIHDATEDLLEDVGRLKRWLTYSPDTGPSRPGYRPPTVVVPEFTEDGKPHVHVAFFGVGWLTTHGALSNYWDRRRDRGSIVWMDRIVNRDGRWRWAAPRSERSHSDTENRSPRSYLIESVDLLAASAGASAAEVQEAADALRADGSDDGAGPDAMAKEHGDRLWKVALYWATETPAFTLSPALKPSESDDTDRAPAPDGTPLPADAPPRWRYVGTARYGDFPAHVTAHAMVCTRSGRRPGRPPPDRQDAMYDAPHPGECTTVEGSPR